MRIDIKTNGIVRDKDVRALYMISVAIEQSTPKMREANLQFIADRYGLRVEPKSLCRIIKIERQIPQSK